MRTPAPRHLLRKFIKERGLSVCEAARQLKLTHPALLAWLDGTSLPKEPFRRAIEKWTEGAVPASMWETEDEREIVERVVPFSQQSAATKAA